MKSRRAVLLSGSGRYADPWHPFEETTPILADLLGAAGYRVEITRDIDSWLTEGVAPDLLAVNCGLPRDGGPVPSAAARQGLREVLDSGCALLACHVAATTFIDAPEWEAALGGAWVRGVSMHPPFSEAQVRIHGHALTGEITDFTVLDERYTSLRVSPDVEILASHEHDGLEHTLVWIKERTGLLGRAAYDALGHDVRSFESLEHVRLLERMITWLGRR